MVKSFRILVYHSENYFLNRAFKEGTQAITAGADVFEAAFGMPSIAKAVDDFEEDWSAVHHKNTI